MSASESQLKANKKYHQKFHKLQVRMTHDEQTILEAHTATTGESVNAYVRRAIFETMERDRQKEDRKQNPDG